MTSLTATYRLQFHKEFNFDDLREIVPYLKKLGVTTLYASPIFTSVPGSTHGYDGLNPHRINPEIGSVEVLKEISRELRANDINWLQDIVPNHMAFDPRNEWLMDVLEKGPQSVYASFFDIAWNSPLYQGRLMVPFLGRPVEEAIKQGELKIDFAGDRFVFRYFDSVYPLQPLSYGTILQQKNDRVPDAISQLLQQIPKMEEENAYAEQWDELRQQIKGLQKNELVKNFIQDCIQQTNENRELLLKIEGQQSYRLCFWQETDQKINYRRFFTVNGLICLNIQDEKVFQTYHQLIKNLVDEGIFQGLRIDHIDGLYDPSQYLHRLRELAGEEVPIVVEKILEPGEDLPSSWPIQGNTGYDFLSMVNNLFTNQRNEKLFTRFYRQLVKDKHSIQEQLKEKKAHVLYRHMGGELDNLYRLFRESNLVEKKAFASMRPEDLKEAIGEFLIHCPVYRFYGNKFPLEEQEAQSVRGILDQVKTSNSELRKAADMLEFVFLKKPQEGNEEINQKISHFYQRCMQFTGPLMAKGMEDTLMYTYHRFIAHNEVGDSPESFGLSVDEFHQSMQQRQKRWPYSLNATSTHDTKRGEDVRARLNVLSDLGEEWLEQVKQYQKMNAALRNEGAPDANDEYFIYQTLAGAWPMDDDHGDFSGRIDEYLQKALREAKVHSNWTSPDEAYELATKNFAKTLLDKRHRFSKSFEAFQDKIRDHGIVNSLSQLILKFTCPGIPDVYQGCELWDLSLVDPDNRRPVDYKKRNKWIEEVSSESDPKELWEDRRNGKIKLWLTQQLFALRKQFPELWTTGEYIPLQVTGSYSDHVMAFAREYRQNIFVIALPLHTALLSREQNKAITEIDWKDTRIQLPEGAAPEWQQIPGLESIEVKKGFLVSRVFSELPFAVLKGQRLTNERGSGILLHI
ncbi:MAG: malto-oligosyltrehalose synthase, partial [Flavisolibacter sp.]